MNIITCELPGLLIIEPKVFGDARGFFMETWNRQRYHEAGLDWNFVQDNVSLSRRGILRGLHFQNPSAQGKLVYVLQGEVFERRGGYPAQFAHVWPVARPAALRREQAAVFHPAGFRAWFRGVE